MQNGAILLTGKVHATLNKQQLILKGKNVLIQERVHNKGVILHITSETWDETILEDCETLIMESQFTNDNIVNAISVKNQSRISIDHISSVLKTDLFCISLSDDARCDLFNTEIDCIRFNTADDSTFNVLGKSSRIQQLIGHMKGRSKALVQPLPIKIELNMNSKTCFVLSNNGVISEDLNLDLIKLASRARFVVESINKGVTRKQLDLDSVAIEIELKHREIKKQIEIQRLLIQREQERIRKEKEDKEREEVLKKRKKEATNKFNILTKVDSKQTYCEPYTHEMRENLVFIKSIINEARKVLRIDYTEDTWFEQLIELSIKLYLTRKDIRKTLICKDIYYQESVFDQEQDEDGIQCDACSENRVCVVILPCKHSYYCWSCTRKSFESRQNVWCCPLCRTEIVDLDKC